MTSTITIIAHSGHNLIAADGVLRKTSSDPYLKFRAGNVRARTKYVLKTLNPVWDETVVLRHIDVHNIEQKTLHIKCRDWDRLTRDDPLGETHIDLSTLDARGAPVHEFDLELKGGKGGHIKISVKVEREMRAQDAARVSSKLIQRLKAARQRYNDPDFPHDNRSLFKDKSLHKKDADGKWESKYEWKRLSTLVPNAKLFVDGVESGDVVQGALGDCYLLGALSVVGTRKDLVSPLFVTANAALGLYQVRFFKNEWLAVTIDDFVPCVGNTPVYARCHDANEMWVPLVEKAYAKLHGGYEEIESGSIASALIDLTGEASDSIDLTKEAIDNREALWARLLHAQKEGYLMGCSCSKGGSEEDTGRGILAGHAYGVLQIAEEDGFKLIQFRNPWGNDKEWTGPWSDASQNWAQNLALAKKLKFKAADDGVFWMSFDDFLAEFTNLWILHLLGDRKGAKWHRTEKQGEWKGRSAGGCFNHSTFANNPQFGITARFNDTKLFVCLLQADKRLRGDATYANAIGLSFVNAPPATDNSPFKRLFAVNAADKSSSYAPERSVVLEFGPLSAGQRVVVIPATFDAGAELGFTLVVFSSNEVVCEELEGRDPVVVEGEWTKESAGGCVNHDTWKKNPAFSLVTPSLKPIEATIKIEQEERDELYHIGASFGKGDQPLQLEIGKDLTCINSRSVSMDVKIEPATPYWLVPQTYAPDLLGKFTVSVYVHDPEGEVWVKPL